MRQNPNYNVSINETESDELVPSRNENLEKNPLADFEERFREKQRQSSSIMKTPAPPESSRKRKSNDKR